MCFPQTNKQISNQFSQFIHNFIHDYQFLDVNFDCVCGFMSNYLFYSTRFIK